LSSAPQTPPPPPPRNQASAPSSASTSASSSSAPTAPAAPVLEGCNSSSQGGGGSQKPAWARSHNTVIATFLTVFCASPAHREMNPGHYRPFLPTEHCLPFLLLESPFIHFCRWTRGLFVHALSKFYPRCSCAFALHLFFSLSVY
jgi:hypothetical protein